MEFKLFIRLIHLLFVAAIVSACQSTDETSLSEQEKDVLIYSMQKEDSTVDKVPNEMIVEVDKQQNNFPLLLIQNWGALLPHKCNLKDSISQDSLRTTVFSFFSSDSLVSIGTNGVLRQEIGSVFCMKENAMEISWHLG